MPMSAAPGPATLSTSSSCASESAAIEERLATRSEGHIPGLRLHYADQRSRVATVRLRLSPSRGRARHRVTALLSRRLARRAPGSLGPPAERRVARFHQVIEGWAGSSMAPYWRWDRVGQSGCELRPGTQGWGRAERSARSVAYGSTPARRYAADLLPARMPGVFAESAVSPQNRTASGETRRPLGLGLVE